MKLNWKELLPYIIIIVAVLGIKIFLVTPIRVNGPSMEPTLQQKDIMILNKTAYFFREPKRFEIIVFDTKDSYLIKRVIGLPGEEISYKDNQLYVNGKKIKQPVEHGKTDDFTTADLGVKTIPEDTYLVLGDNREESLDSRSKEVGLIARKNIKGRTSLTILPFNRVGFKK